LKKKGTMEGGKQSTYGAIAGELLSLEEFSSVLRH